MDKIEKMDKVKAVHDILDLEEIEEMIPIDEDLALKMKKEVKTFEYLIPLPLTLRNPKSKTLDISKLCILFD